MKTLTRYLAFKLFFAAAGVTAMLAAITEIIDLFDSTDDILKAGGGFGGFVYYVVLRLPSIVPQVLPLSVLIAALFTFSLLARNGEFVAMRNAGLSMMGIVSALIPAVIVLGLIHYAVSETLTAPAEQHLAAWWAANLSDPGARANRPVWLKVGGSIVSVDRVSDHGRRLAGVRIYKRDSSGVTTARIKAGKAVYHRGEWTLDNADVSRWPKDKPATNAPADGPWKSRLRPASVMEALTPEGHVSAATAEAVLSGRRIATTGRPVYETALQQAFAGPAASLAMLLIAVPMAFANPRRAGSGRYLLVGLATGLLFMLVAGIAMTLGGAGVINPVAASWGPVIVFSLFGLFRVKRLENVRNQA